MRKAIVIKPGQVWEKGGGRCEVYWISGQNIAFCWDGPANCMPPMLPWDEDNLGAFRRWAAGAQLVSEGNTEAMA